MVIIVFKVWCNSKWNMFFVFLAAISSAPSTSTNLVSSPKNKIVKFQQNVHRTLFFQNVSWVFEILSIWFFYPGISNADSVIAVVSSPTRFVHSTEKEVQQSLLPERVKNTDKTTKTAINCFLAWMDANNIDKKLEDLTTEDLLSFMPKFFLEARKTNGTVYPARSLQQYTIGIQRYLSGTRQSPIFKSIVAPRIPLRWPFRQSFKVALLQEGIFIKKSQKKTSNNKYRPLAITYFRLVHLRIAQSMWTSTINKWKIFFLCKNHVFQSLMTFSFIVVSFSFAKGRPNNCSDLSLLLLLVVAKLCREKVYMIARFRREKVYMIARFCFRRNCQNILRRNAVKK